MDVVDHVVEADEAAGVLGCEGIFVRPLSEGVLLGLVDVLDCDFGHV